MFPPTTRSQTAPSAAETGVAYADPSKRVALRYPAGWAERPVPDFVLNLVPRDDPSAGASVSLDVPDLPLRVPFLLRGNFNRIVSEYLNDLKKAHPDLRAEEQTSPPLPDTLTRRVRSTWQVGGRQYNQVGLVMVHGDGVYILRATGPADTFSETLRAFDAVVASLRWL